VSLGGSLNYDMRRAPASTVFSKLMASQYAQDAHSATQADQMHRMSA
jgi:hypothetical protein